MVAVLPEEKAPDEGLDLDEAIEELLQPLRRQVDVHELRLLDLSDVPLGYLDRRRVVNGWIDALQLFFRAIGCWLLLERDLLAQIGVEALVLSCELGQGSLHRLVVPLQVRLVLLDRLYPVLLLLLLRHLLVQYLGSRSSCELI